jgi:hypothetical protein
VTSLRRFKKQRDKQAEQLGVSSSELALVELLEEILESLRWAQVLGYANQFHVTQKLKVDQAERDRILAAAARMVDKDQKLHEWKERLAALKGDLLQKKRDLARARREIAGEGNAP